MKLGILGGGQLARMLTLAAYPLGIHTVCLDPNPEACAKDVTQLITAEFTNESALRQLATGVDCITFETENIPLQCAEFLAATKTLHPAIKALEITQDRLSEKSFLQSLQIPTAKFVGVANCDELTQAVDDIGLPAILKIRRFGYDGKGQYVLRDSADIANAWHSLQSNSLILEKFISFEYELSLIAVRNKQGETHFYPLTRNHHTQGILRSCEAPFNDPILQQQAQQQAIQILDALQYVGVLTIEYFYDGEKLIANEIAPRVHNSGHWTIEGTQTSQFENHLRAIFDLPLGNTQATGHCFLLNCIGNMLPLEPCLAIPGVHYHTYEKTPRPARKLGHITLVDADSERYHKSKQALCKIGNYE